MLMREQNEHNVDGSFVHYLNDTVFGYREHCGLCRDALAFNFHNV